MKHLLTTLLVFSGYLAVAQPAWQQRVDSKIDVRLDDKRNVLYAWEEVTYTNNSPDTLHYIYVHLWPNAYKHDHTPFARQLDLNRNTSFYYSKKKDRGYIDSLQFTIDGYAVDYTSSDNAPDIARIDLRDPLLPGHSMKITTPFRVKIPKVFSRMGHTGQAYYVSQWFPKPAVYDKAGWHPISYLDQGEFYSEYGSWDVSITLPANYVVMATGNCTDEKENAWLDELARKPLPELPAKIKAHKDTIPPSSAEMKTIHFHEDNVHDFAWFADKRFLIKKDTVTSPGNGLLVTTWAAFLPSYARQWQNANNLLRGTVEHYGKWIGPYQYKTIKAVEGDLRAGGGMEYPTVTIIDKSASKALDLVITHEAGHNWFYGMLGSNERDHAWMDEGINTFYEEKVNSESARKKKKAGLDETLVYYERAATRNDQAIEQTAANFERNNYGLDIYFKTALSLRWLEQYMGETAFEAGMHEYYDKWHFHHPQPGDFRECMQRHSSKSIDWFFDNILTNDKKIDFTIKKAKINGDHTEVTVCNKTGVLAPVVIDAVDDSVISKGWSAPFEGTTTVSVPGTDWRKLKIDNVIPDAKTTNNTYPHTIFHHFGLQLKPLAGINRSDKDKLFIAPAVGYNQYDGIMAGLLLHDLTLPENSFRFALAPMYSFVSNSLVGCGSVGYLWYGNGLFKETMAQVDGKIFHYNEVLQPNGSDHLYAGYSKIAPSLSFTFNEHNPLSSVKRTLILKGYYIDEEYFDAIASVPVVAVPYFIGHKHNNYGALTYSHSNNRTYNPLAYGLNGQVGADFVKLGAAGSIRIDYNTRGKHLFVRGYFGKFFAINNTAEVISRYSLNATYIGADDYLYDGTYLARNARTGFASQQISIQEGGFKVPTYNNAGRSDNWMGAVNLKSDLPFVKLPIYVFVDAGLIPNSNPSFTHPGGTTTLYDAGLEVHLLGVCSFYFPIIMSDDFQNNLTKMYGKKNVFAHSISFTLQFTGLNWLKAPSTVLGQLMN